MKRVKKTIGLIVLFLGTIVMTGCGTDDLLDETGDRYTGSIELADDGEGSSTTLTIDIHRADCIDDEGNSEPEEFSDTVAIVTITADEDAPTITLEDYTLEWYPLESENSSGSLELPPEIPDPDKGNYSFTITGSSTNSITMECLTATSKLNLPARVAAEGNFSAADVLRYTVRITLYFEDSFGKERVIQLERTVYLGAYDHC
ncbi:MAG: hypothetical protein GY874_06905 [Desulfobacteraceae bacterium]|nr:hypothetical protein [Desulfobacteraceae bacterium]